MSNKPDNTSAFPIVVPGFSYGDGISETPYIKDTGMTLRDYFAAKAMLGELITAGALPEPRDALIEAAKKAGLSIEQQIAANSYKLADAMLRERHNLEK